jgi:hypothetical protein
VLLPQSGGFGGREEPDKKGDEDGRVCWQRAEMPREGKQISELSDGSPSIEVDAESRSTRLVMALDEEARELSSSVTVGAFFGWSFCHSFQFIP